MLPSCWKGAFSFCQKNSNREFIYRALRVALVLDLHSTYTRIMVIILVKFLGGIGETKYLVKNLLSHTPL